MDWSSDDESEEGDAKRKKIKLPKDDGRNNDEIKYAMKYALREHVHELRTLNKELAGRIRSLRYFKWVLDFNKEDTFVECNGKLVGRKCCPGAKIKAADAGVLSRCATTSFEATS